MLRSTKDLPGANHQAVIYVAHLYQLLSLAVETDTPVLEPDVTRVPGVGVWKNSHESRFIGFPERCGHGLITDRKIGISVKHKESIRQKS